MVLLLRSFYTSSSISFWEPCHLPVNCGIGIKANFLYSHFLFSFGGKIQTVTSSGESLNFHLRHACATNVHRKGSCIGQNCCKISKNWKQLKINVYSICELLVNWGLGGKFIHTFYLFHELDQFPETKLALQHTSGDNETNKQKKSLFFLSQGS